MLIHDNTVLESKPLHFGEQIVLYPKERLFSPVVFSHSCGKRSPSRQLAPRASALPRAHTSEQFGDAIHRPLEGRAPPCTRLIKIMLATIDRLLVEASPASTRTLNRGRILKREPIHQLVALLPHLTDAQQSLALRRLQQLVGRSLYNLNVCTAGLQLVSVILRWLQPDALPLSPEVIDEVLQALAALGGYRATAQELRTLFELLQAALTPGLARPGKASANQLLRLLTRWCEPSARDRTREVGPPGPIACFDFDGVGGGLTLPPELAVELVSKGAFTLGGWVRLEEATSVGVAAEGVLLFGMLGKAGEVGVEVYLQPAHEQVSLCVFGGAASAASKLLRRGKAPAERTSLRGVVLTPGRWHLLLVSLRRAPVMRGRHEAFLFLDGVRVQATPCAYPASLIDKAGDAPPTFNVGALVPPVGPPAPTPPAIMQVTPPPPPTGTIHFGRPPSYPAPSAAPSASAPPAGFAGQLGTILLLRGVPTEAEAQSLYLAGTRCADLDGACAAAHSATNSMMGTSRGVSVLAAFAAETAYSGACAAVCGAAGLRATISNGVSILRPIDVRASLGGPLPLLPLIELVSDAARHGSTTHASMLSPIVHALTALLRGEPIHQIELLRAEALGMLAHLLAACPAATIDAELLAAFCGLESALEGSDELSDQLLNRIFLRLSLWAKGGFEIAQPVLRQLCRMAGERPEQWVRTDAIPRLVDAMLETVPWRTAAPPTAHAASNGIADPADERADPADSSAAPQASHAGQLNARRAYTELEQQALWDVAFDVLCSMADTPQGISPAHLRYVVHCALRSASRGVISSLTRMLVARTYTLDLRLIETLLEGGATSLFNALLSSMGQSDLLPDEGVALEELRALIVRLVGRVVWLGTPPRDHERTAAESAASHAAAAAAASAPRLAAAARWMSASSWAKCGWAWLGFALSGAPTQGQLLEATTEVLLGTITQPQRRVSTANVVDVSDQDGEGRTRTDSIEAHIAVGDDSASAFANPQLLLPLLHLSSNAPPHLQRSLVLNLSLWLRHSNGSLNQAMLTAQPGWQLPVCSMLNGNANGDDADDTTHALCVRLIAEHVVSLMRHGGGGDGWVEVQRTLSFIEAHTANPTDVKHAVFDHVLELLRGSIALPTVAAAAQSAAAGGNGGTHAAGGVADQSLEGIVAMWGMVLRLAMLVEESLLRWDQAAWAAQHFSQQEHQPKAKGSIVSRLLTGGTRPAATSASSTRTASTSLGAGGGTGFVRPSMPDAVSAASSVSAVTDPANAVASSGAPMISKEARTTSFTVELEAEAAVARLLGGSAVSALSPPSWGAESGVSPFVQPPPFTNAGATACGSGGHSSADPAASAMEQATIGPPTLPALPSPTEQLRRDEGGAWTDAPLVIKLLKLIDPLVIKSIVEPLASHVLHMSAAAMAPRDGGGGSGTSLFSSVRGMMGGGDHTPRPHEKEATDTLCDVITRLQLLVLLECDQAMVADKYGGFDPARQLQELLLCAACWCQKPTQDAEAVASGAAPGAQPASLEPSRSVAQQQLGSAMVRLIQAWPVATQPLAVVQAGSDGASTADGSAAVVTAASDADTRGSAGMHAASCTAAMASAVAPVVRGLLKLSATPDELRTIPMIVTDTPGATSSIQAFVDAAHSWRVVLLREPFIQALRALESSDSPSKLASERWAVRQRALVSQEDRTQREHRTLAEKIHSEISSALRALASEAAPRVAVARSGTARARAAAAQRWWWTRYRLHEDDPIWGVNATAGKDSARESAGGVADDVVPSAARADGSAAASEANVELRLAEWLDVRSRHLLVVPNVEHPPQGSAEARSASTARSAIASGQSGGDASREASSRDADGGGDTAHASSQQLSNMGVRLPRMLTSITGSLLKTDSGEGGEGGEGDEEEEDEEGDEEEGDAAAMEGMGSTIFQSECDLVRPYGLVPGRIYLSERHLRFVGSGGVGEGSLESEASSAVARDSALTWPLSTIKQMHRRRYSPRTPWPRGMPSSSLCLADMWACPLLIPPAHAW